MNRFDARMGDYHVDLKTYAPGCKGFEVPEGTKPKTLRACVCVYSRILSANAPTNCFVDSRGLNGVIREVRLCPGRDDPQEAIENRIAQSQELFKLQES